jgi:hypothetical protein
MVKFSEISEIGSSLSLGSIRQWQRQVRDGDAGGSCRPEEPRMVWHGHGEADQEVGPVEAARRSCSSLRASLGLANLSADVVVLRKRNRGFVSVAEPFKTECIPMSLAAGAIGELPGVAKKRFDQAFWIVIQQ